MALGYILRFRLEWKQKPRKVNVRRIPYVESLPMIQQQQDTDVKQNYTQ